MKSEAWLSVEKSDSIFISNNAKEKGCYYIEWNDFIKDSVDLMSNKLKKEWAKKLRDFAEELVK